MKQKAHVVRSQLIPLAGMELVLPNTSIAEVINAQSPEPLENEHQWILGMIEWRGVKIPLLCYEASLGNLQTNINSQSRIAVLNAMDAKVSSFSFYAVLIQGIPRLVTLNDENITDSPEAEGGPYILRQTLVNGSPAIIPDQAQLESELGKLSIN